MRTWIILLLASIASAQIVAKTTVITGNKKVEYVSQGKLICVDKTEQGKTTKLTCMDAEFTAYAKDRPVDTDKSIVAAINDMIAIAKKTKTIITVIDSKGNKITFDLEKENEKSVYAGLLSALKSGYKPFAAVEKTRKIKT
jgi:hypothetical protein